MREIEAYLAAVIEEKRRAPDAGAISRILHGTRGGRPLTAQDIFGYTFFLFVAGIDTVYAAMNNIWVWLAGHPERRAEIIARPHDIDAQLEERLRVFGVAFSGREAREGTVLDGANIRKGERVICLLPACNYDPDVFPQPREVRFDRPRKPILTFAGGIHACMGAHLARLEMKIALQEWLRRIPHFAIRPGSPVAYEVSGVTGPSAVHLAW